MFLTFPTTTSPSRIFSRIVFRPASRFCSSCARLETTTLAFFRESLSPLNFPSSPVTDSLSRTGRRSTWLPGRKAFTQSMSTVYPPLTLATIFPGTGVPSSWAFWRSSHIRARSTFSRDSRNNPVGFPVDVDRDEILQHLDHHPVDDLALLGGFQALLEQLSEVVLDPAR